MRQPHNDQQDQDLWEFARRLVPLSTPVLIEGEPGTGKSSLARNLHRQSSRSEQPRVELDCAEIPAKDMDVLFFGSGGKEAKPGALLAADKGALILHNIDLLTFQVQDRLFRFLDEGSFVRPGEPGKRIEADVRIIATTQKSLLEYQRQDLFHKKLYYRFKPCLVKIPALRERPGHVREMAYRFLEGFRLEHPDLLGADKPWAFKEDVYGLFLAMPWPDNLHGLRRAVESIAQFGPKEKEAIDLLDVIRVLLDPDFGVYDANVKEGSDAGYLRSMLEITRWDLPLAGRITGYARATLKKRMEEQRWQKP